MACALSPQCNFLYGFFKCQLPEDTKDMEITVRTLKGIHTFRKYCATQLSMCSQWCSQIRPFPSLIRKMEAYMEEKRNTANPFPLPGDIEIDPVYHPFLRKSPPPKEAELRVREAVRNTTS